MKKLHSLIFTALLFLSSILPVAPVFADANNFYFKDLTIDYNLHKTSENTSVMEVTETFTAEFPNYNQNHGIERVIPFLNQNDTNLTMESASNLSIEVTRNGNKEPYTVKTGSTNFTVRIGSVNDYVQGEQVYVLKYKFINVITSFKESGYSTNPYQELYWDTNGTGWFQRFDNVTVNLHMDEEIKNAIIPEREISYITSYKTKSTIHKNNKTEGRLAAWCYVGVHGSSNQDRCEINDLEDGIQYKTSALGSGENMTIVLNFNDDAFVVPKNNFISKTNFKDINIDYYLSRDEEGHAKLKIKESMTVLFPTLNEISRFTRYVPFVADDGVRFITKSQKNLDIEVTMDGVKIEPDYIYTNDDGYFIVPIESEERYLHGEHTLTYEYELDDIVEPLTNPKTNEQIQYLHLSTLGKYFGYDVSSLKATIHIDEDLLSEISESTYTDEQDQDYNLKTYCADGTTQGHVNRRCTITENEDGYTYYINDLVSTAYLDFTIHFKDGTFVIPEPNRNYIIWHIFGIFVIVISIIIAVVISKTYRKVASKIKYLKSLPVVPQYAPIKDITVAEIGKNYLQPTKNHKVATLLELIVDKKITLIRKEHKTFLGGTKYDWYVEIINPVHLSTEQQDLLAILDNGHYVYDDESWKDKEIQICHHNYSSRLEDAFDNYEMHVNRALKNDGLMEEKASHRDIKNLTKNGVNSFFNVIGFIIVTYMAIFCFSSFFISLIKSYSEEAGFTKFAIFEGSFLIPIMIIIALITAITLPILSIYSERYKARTERGLEISRYTDGLKLYIKMAEADRLKFLQSVEGVDTSEAGIVNLYEKLLPYAALFGLEKSWMNELKKYYELEDIESPDWYDSDFSYAALGSIMHSAISRPIDTSSSSGGWSSGGGGGFSSSSGSSGGGGGGYSGGGGGGGGGGGW